MTGCSSRMWRGRRSSSLRAVDHEDAIGAALEPIAQQYRLRGDIVSIGLGNDSIRTVLPRLLQDQRAGPARYPRPRQAGTTL